MRIEAAVILNRCVNYLAISDTGSRNHIGSIFGLSKIITICRRRNFKTKKVIKRIETSLVIIISSHVIIILSTYKRRIVIP